MARLRTFIALDLGKAIRDRLVALQSNLAKELHGVKWVEPENIHLTLLFLGEVEDRDVPAVCRAVENVGHALAPFTLAVAGPGCFPNPRRPRVLWVGVAAGAQEVVALHDALEPPLLELGCYRREDRPYTPHVTLGRLKGEAAPVGLDRLLAKQQSWRAGETLVREVQVMSSELGRDGPTYAVLSRARLG